MKLQRILIDTHTSARIVGAVGLLLSISALTSQAEAPQSVYKITDDKGRVTYSNAPSKGAVAVELAPITVMPAHRIPARAPATAATSPANDAPLTAALPAISSSAPTPAPVNLPSPAVGILPTPSYESVAIKPRIIAANASPAMMVKQRREEVRRRILEGEIEAEQQLQQDARSALAAEQARSAAMRALRGSLPNEARPSETTLEARALIERHFARVRDLQDQVAMHAQNLLEMQAQLALVSPSATLAAAEAKPVATKSLASTASTVIAARALPATKPAPAKPIASIPVAIVTSKPSKLATIKPVAAPPVAPAPAAAAADNSADETPMSATNLPVVKMRPATVAVAAPSAGAGKRTMAENRNE